MHPHKLGKADLRFQTFAVGVQAHILILDDSLDYSNARGASYAWVTGAAVGDPPEKRHLADVDMDHVAR